MSATDQVSLVGNNLVHDLPSEIKLPAIGNASGVISEPHPNSDSNTGQRAPPMTPYLNSNWYPHQATSSSSIDRNPRKSSVHNTLKVAEPKSRSILGSEIKGRETVSKKTGIMEDGRLTQSHKPAANLELRGGAAAYKRNNSRINGEGRANRDSKWPTNTEILGYPAGFKKNKYSASGDVRGNHNSKWATAAELRGDSASLNEHKDLQGDDDVRSNQADYGQDNAGVKLEAGDQNYQLADWEGNWAPAPIDWEGRGSYTDPLVLERIHDWKKRYTADTYPIDIKIERATGEGEITPRSWVPNDLDGVDPTIWWANHLRSPDVPPNAKPWWLYFASSSAQHLAKANVPDARLDPTDNDMGKATIQTSEHSILTLDNKQLRQAMNIKKQREQQRAAAKEAASYIPAANKYAPRINIYLRPATPNDIPQITDIYNYYIASTIYCPELEPLSTGQVRDRWTDVTDNKLPFVVAVDASSKGNRRHGHRGAGRANSEHILGFAFADDYNDVRGMYRYTVEVEMFMKPGYTQKGVGRSMMDKLMLVLDPHYLERGGYEFDGDAMQYGSGGRRVVGSVVINIPHDAADTKRLAWIQEWLSQWDFQKVGELSEVGHKVNTTVSQAIFIKKTGSTIQPWAL